MKIVPALITSTTATPGTNNHVSSSTTAFVRHLPSPTTTKSPSNLQVVQKPNLTTMMSATSSSTSSENIYGCKSGCQCNNCQPISSSNCICSGKCGGVGSVSSNGVGVDANINDVSGISRTTLSLGKCDCSCSKCVAFGLMNSIL